jgi:hypothetical protein
MAVNFTSNAGVDYYLSHKELLKLQQAAHRVSLTLDMEVWYSKEDALCLRNKLEIYKNDATVAEFREFLELSEGFFAY